MANSDHSNGVALTGTMAARSTRHRGVPLVRVQLVCIPTSDETFAAEAHDALTHVPSWLDQAAGAEDLQRRLQAAYPGAVVRPREALAEVRTDRPIVWYVPNPAYRRRSA